MESPDRHDTEASDLADRDPALRPDYGDRRRTVWIAACVAVIAAIALAVELPRPRAVTVEPAQIAHQSTAPSDELPAAALPPRPVAASQPLAEPPLRAEQQRETMSGMLERHARAQIPGALTGNDPPPIDARDLPPLKP